MLAGDVVVVASRSDACKSLDEKDVETLNGLPSIKKVRIFLIEGKVRIVGAMSAHRTVECIWMVVRRLHKSTASITGDSAHICYPASTNALGPIARNKQDRGGICM